MPYTKEMIDHLQFQRSLFLAINIVAAISIGILFWLIVDEQHQLEHQAHVIQIQRYETTLIDCQGINKRHDNTVRTIQKAFKGDSDESLPDIHAFVNAALPKRNCTVLATNSVNGKG